MAENSIIMHEQQFQKIKSVLARLFHETAARMVFLVDRVIKPIISTYTKKDSGYYLKIYRNKKIDKISNTYPFGIILKSYFLYLEGKEISDLKKSRDSFSFWQVDL